MKRASILLLAAPLFLLALLSGAWSSPAPVTLPQVHYPVARLATMDASADILTDAISLVRGGISRPLLKEARAIVVFPNISKANTPGGPRIASGVLVTRESSGLWTGPAFVSLSGPTLEAQIRRGTKDLVLVFMTTKSMDVLKMGSVDIGRDVWAAKGLSPSGANLEADVLAFGRSNISFEGVSLIRSVVRYDGYANAKFYDSPGITLNEILSGTTARPIPEDSRMACVLASIGGTHAAHVC